MEDNARIILTSVEHEDDAQNIARQLVERKLAACVQLSAPGTSVYSWQDRIEQSREYYLNIKTTHANARLAIAWLEENHPYDTPEILCLDAEASRDYLQWMRASTA